MASTASSAATAAGASPILDWRFPLPRVHHGALLGNGTLGLMAWGVDALVVTVGRAGFWDHRGSRAFAPPMPYARLRAMLEAGEAEALKRAFADAAGPGPGSQQLGCGRLVVRVPGFAPRSARLDLARGELRVAFAAADGRLGEIVVRQSMTEEVAWLRLDAALGDAEIEAIPASTTCVEYAARGIAPARAWRDDDGGGFVQELPEDEPLALAWTRRAHVVAIATALDPRARERARARARALDPRAAERAADAWWAAYRRDVPRVRVPDADLQHAFDYGIYKQACLTTPGAVAAGLQGPWLEDDRLPPWSADYHFNINVQMIYAPCLATNRVEHLRPMWDLLRGWLPRLRRNAREFFAVDDALMLPHAVDDRCGVVGCFWTGTIDHACIAWMALLAWQHWRHALDEEILREIAWPLLTGAFAGYWAMLEERVEDGARRLSLPLSVSPEYGGDGALAWGRDASFQLAALHAVARALPEAARALGQAADPRWARVRAEVAPYATTGGADARIAVWRGQDLAESHRHHSHLAGIVPFGTVDPDDPAQRDVVERSLRHWVGKGAGGWSGWCVPWAASICARVGWADGAVAWLRWWREVFTNAGHGTLHDVDAPGTTLCDWFQRTGVEVMQADAGMGALSAVIDLLVPRRDDLIAVLPHLPRRWREVAFDGIRCAGAFLVGATVEDGVVREVRVVSERGGRLRLAHGLGPDARLADGTRVGALIERDCRAAETLVVRR